MPIKGITQFRRIPRLGKIRTGIKDQNAKGQEFPREVPHFVLNPIEEIRNEKNEIIGTRENEHIKALIDLFGEEPHELNIVFPVDDEEAICSHYLKWWSGDPKKGKSLLKCRGDGEFANYRGDDRVSGMDLPPDAYPEGMNRVCNPLLCPQAQGKQPLCKPNMNLLFLVPEYSLFGAFQLDTTSSQAMSQISSCLSVARNALRTEGLNSIAGVPMRLYRERKTNKYKGFNYIIHIEVNLKKLKDEKELFISGKRSTLGLGHESYKIELERIEEPNFDLLPKSEFPNEVQTGEPILVEGPKTNPEEWLKDQTVVNMFVELAALKKTTCSKAKMLATSKRFPSKEKLKEYLSGLIRTGKENSDR